MKDDTSERGAPYRGRLRLVIGGTERELPPWADWLMSLGEWMREQTSKSGKRVVIVRLPTRPLASAFVSLGSLFAAARMHDESLDWEALRGLAIGTHVHWRSPNGVKSKRFAGRVASLVSGDGGEFLILEEVDSRGKPKGNKTYLPRKTALSYGVTLGAVSARADASLTSAAALMQALNTDSSVAWSRSPMADSTVVTERSSFVLNLEGIELRARQSHAASMLAALSIADGQGREHGKLKVVSTRTEVVDDAPDGVTVLDGALAASKLGYLKARSLILLLSHSEYDEAVLHEIRPFLSHATDTGIHGWLPGARVGDVPPGIEVFAFGMDAQDVGDLRDVV